MEQTVRAEMVASVHSIVAEVGAAVAVGDTLMILESMKMEIPVVVEVHGTVKDIVVQPGDVVREGDVLVVLD
ncbi:MAG: biotin/lipoyl-binding carrier protein [Candidatus Nanopelagicales bacterium]